MQQFVVPQFIDIEPKILGPLSVRQFIICIIAVLLMVAEWKTTDFSLFIFLAVITIGICGTLAFLKINGRPFHYFILSFIQTFKKPKTRIWQKGSVLPQKKAGPKEEALPPIPSPKKLTGRKLSELTLIIDTGGAYREEESGF